MTSIYVAGGWLEKDTLIKPFIERLKRAGLTITEDWTLADDVGGDGNLTTEQRARAAHADLVGAGEADILWLCMAEYKGARGSFVELGYALAVRDMTAALNQMYGSHEENPKLVIISGQVSKTIFSEMCDHQFAEHEEAFSFIANLGRNRSAS